MEGEWREVGAVSELLDNLPYELIHNDEHIIITREQDEWVAYTLRCPHKGALMRLVDYRDGQLACPLHSWRFDLKNEGNEMHGYVNLMQYETTVRGDKLFVQID